jgi:O-antigen biosynthesis protein
MDHHEHMASDRHDRGFNHELDERGSNPLCLGAHPMTVQRVAIIFDDRARPETTGVYCRRALESLVDVVHFRPDALAEIPREGFDLYLNIDDGFEYRLPAGLRPCTWWAIDTHLSFDRSVRKARDFDLVFAAQCDGAEQLRRAGIGSATWLPLACDPEIQRRHKVAKEYPVALVGNVFLDKLAYYLRRDALREKIAAAGAAQAASKHTYRRRMEQLLGETEAALARQTGLAGWVKPTDPNANTGGLHPPHGPAGTEARPTVQAGAAESCWQDPAGTEARPTVQAGATSGVPKGLPRGAGIPARVEHGLARADDQLNGHPQQDPIYFSHPRPEILALVPESATRVLDIGCGAGRFGEALRARQQAEVIGIELNEDDAALAANRVDRVIAGDVEQLTLDFEPGAFDAIVCGDILEHLREPERSRLPGRRQSGDENGGRATRAAS